MWRTVGIRQQNGHLGGSSRSGKGEVVVGQGPTKKAESMDGISFYSAVTAGFEPAVPLSEYAGLANQWFQPLTHVTSD